MDLLPPLLLLLGGLWVQYARAGSHSHRDFYSGLSEEVPGVPRFSAVGFVDDVPIEGYSSETRRLEPRAPWVEKDLQYLERSTESLRGQEQAMRSEVRIVMERVNQTRGLHSLQVMVGCELRGDGSMGGFLQFGYDGEDLMSLDKDRMRFIAAATPAQVTADRWNSDKSFAQRLKAYLEGECIEWLQKHLQYGKDSLLRGEMCSTMEWLEEHFPHEEMSENSDNNDHTNIENVTPKDTLEKTLERMEQKVDMLKENFNGLKQWRTT